MNILIVDDEIKILESVREKVLELFPNDGVYAFDKAKEALDFIKDNYVDVALLDINMRIVSGLDIAKQIQKLYPKVNLIFETGYSEYALDALDLECSQYLLKPITKEKLEKAFGNLRYPVEEKQSRVRICCYGDFEVYIDNAPVSFKYKKSKELLAYLVHHKGTNVDIRKIIHDLFEEDQLSYFSNVRRDLLLKFKAKNLRDVFRTTKGVIGIDKDKVNCDYFDYLDGKISKPKGKYMPNYHF